MYDVVIDGVSLVNNYRGQFRQILTSSSYPGLVDQLQSPIRSKPLSQGVVDSGERHAGHHLLSIGILLALTGLLFVVSGFALADARFPGPIGLTSKNDGNDAGLIAPICDLGPTAS